MAIALNHYDVIVSPVITEKSTEASEHNQVVFRVAKTATTARSATTSTRPSRT